VCQDLEQELAQFERGHKEQARLREENSPPFSVREERQFRIAEKAAMLKMEIVRAELKRHKWSEHGIAPREADLESNR
jgi:hypothetical protein